MVLSSRAHMQVTKIKASMRDDTAARGGNVIRYGFQVLGKSMVGPHAGPFIVETLGNTTRQSGIGSKTANMTI
eukprot:6148386-Pyramimonas_sp.AAC.1